MENSFYYVQNPKNLNRLKLSTKKSAKILKKVIAFIKNLCAKIKARRECCLSLPLSNKIKRRIIYIMNKKSL